ncbi:hypothetical protein [Erwinia sp.]|nr:hypothetical protein [Erwinia sp.]
MQSSKLIVLIERIAISIFAALLLYFIVTGLFSASGWDHSWPYPHH